MLVAWNGKTGWKKLRLPKGINTSLMNSGSHSITPGPRRPLILHYDPVLTGT